MNSIISVIAGKIKNTTALTRYTWVLGFACVLYLSFFRYEGPWHWDDVTYLMSILRLRYLPLLLARTGFCYPFILIWMMLKNFTVLKFDIIENIILFSNLVFLTLSYLLTFRILVAVKVPMKAALICVLLLLSELSFSVLGSRYADTPMMHFCVLLSFYLFIKAHEQQNFRILLFSGFFAGYSVLVREPAVFYFLSFLFAFGWFKKRNLTFKFEKYFCFVALLFAVAASGPLLLLINYKGKFVETVINSMEYYTVKEDLLTRIQFFWNSHINYVWACLAAMGAVFAIQKMKKIWLLSFVFLCLSPVAFLIAFSGIEFIMEPRFFFGLFLLQSLGAAFLINGVSERIPKKIISSAVMVLSTGLLMFYGTFQYWPQYQKELQISRQLQDFHSKIDHLLKGRTALIFGFESLYFLYKTMQEKEDSVIISSGMNWPRGRLTEVIAENLKDERMVLYNPKGAEHNKNKREADLKRMVEQFKLTEIEQGLMRVEFKEK